ncbi:MAG: threonylcarbamoyl-AMP synthase [Oscillospiraceae bacterium]|nr:threonylcarbamoyl-AMP synthase [Oscillospiraceae bacterium]
MNTVILSASNEDIAFAASLINKGEVVGIPTETVYGLAADAMNEEAVKKIFKAKGRPADNPLIVHVSRFEMVYDIALEIPPLAHKLAERFWPGPLTMIMPKSDKIPDVTSGGLDTVGIRYPSHPVAQALINISDKPLAAPSANLSGSPSPTNCARVYEDMRGRIPAIIDGGECDVGVESTVISFEDGGIRILRPGKISVEDFLTVTDKVYVDKGVLAQLDADAVAKSPGMKYKHYSPKANIILIDSEVDAFKNYVSQNKCENTYCLLFDESEAVAGVGFLTYGVTSEEQAHYLFERLREFDEMGAKTVYARCPSKDGVGLAVYNRILRSAGFNLIKL